MVIGKILICGQKEYVESLHEIGSVVSLTWRYTYNVLMAISTISTIPQYIYIVINP